MIKRLVIFNFVGVICSTALNVSTIKMLLPILFIVICYEIIIAKITNVRLQM